jgi:hypothetical protein
MIGDASPSQIGTATSEAPRDTSANQQSRSKGGQNRRGGRPSEGSDDRRRRKSQNGDRRAISGFGDGVERAFCLSLRHRPPPDFPVQHRTGVAALVPTIVARRPEAVLLCDCVHEGPHAWPDGDLVGDGDS